MSHLGVQHLALEHFDRHVCRSVDPSFDISSTGRSLPSLDVVHLMCLCFPAGAERLHLRCQSKKTNKNNFSFLVSPFKGTRGFWDKSSAEQPRLIWSPCVDFTGGTN